MKSDRQTPRLRYSVTRAAGWLCWLLILLAICGCDASTVVSPGTSSPAPEPQPTLVDPVQGAPPTMPMEPTLPQPTEVAPTQSPPPPETQIAPTLDQPAPVCQAPGDLQAVFVADLGLADSTAIPPDAPFRKIWRVRNSGDCTWPEGTELLRVSGDALPGPSRVPVQSAAPGQEIDVVVDLTAPTRSARYTSFWRFQAGGEHLFGAVVYLEIVVSIHANPPPIAAVPSPTSAPTAPPLPTASPTAAPTAPSDPTPTVQLTEDGGSLCDGIDPRFGPLVYQANQLSIRLPCATGPLSTHGGWMQVYWQEIDQSSPPLRLLSLVIVRNDTQTIYVLDGNDTTAYRAAAYAFQNTWADGLPERMPACTPLVPPPGYTVPTHGIGKVWCEESLWNTIGWPEGAPKLATLAIQGRSTNLLIEVTAGTEKPYLVAIDLEARRATVHQAP